MAVRCSARCLRHAEGELRPAYSQAVRSCFQGYSAHAATELINAHENGCYASHSALYLDQAYRNHAQPACSCIGEHHYYTAHIMYKRQRRRIPLLPVPMLQGCLILTATPSAC